MHSSESGFSLVELVIAVVVFAVGALGFAGSTAFLTRQNSVAALTSERNAALITAIERIRSTDYDSLAAGADSVGRYAVTWSVQPSANSALVTIITRGPGLGSTPGQGIPTIRADAADTFAYRVLSP